ncbi:MAG TPA: alpha/beta hydrolase [Myxococcota bacterium]|nr:alpha/beta hydrolase [Myxococcota bacterium]
MESPESLYESARPERTEVDDATLAVRSLGHGPVVLFVHGFPVHGYTWRRLLPALSERFRCILPDLAGLGDSDWNAATDFSFSGQARRLHLLAERMGLERFALVAQDTGATVARLLALAAPERVTRIALINTEIPGHRPPWIPLYQRLTHVPGSASVFRLLLQSRTFLHSSMGFREFYTERRRLDEPGALDPYVGPLIASPHRMEGMLRYLQGAEWDAVDGLGERHAELKMPALLLWGEDDRTFPVERAEPMAAQFGGPTRFVRIPHASLMPHEERPDAVLAELLPFLLRC